MQHTLVDEVQVLVDRLAARLHQSIAVDARDGELIAVSRHFGDADPYRMHLLLHRRMPPGARDYFGSFVRDLRGTAPVRVPGNREMSIEPRWCFPVGEGIAYLWIIDRGAALPNDEIERYCHRLAAILGERTAGQDDAEQEIGTASWVRALLLGEQSAPEPEIDASGSLYAVVACSAGEHGARPTEDRLLRALRPASLCGLSPTTALEADGFAVAVLAGEAADGVIERGALEWLRSEGPRGLEESGLPGGAGLAGLASASELRALYGRAAIAAVLCRELYRTERLLVWTEVAGLAAAAVAGAGDDGASRSGMLAAALRDPEGFAFETVGAFLRSSPETGPAALLHVHRTTVNYRVRQLADHTGVDLMVPADRFLAFVEWLRALLERELPPELLTSALGPAWSTRAAGTGYSPDTGGAA